MPPPVSEDETSSVDLEVTTPTTGDTKTTKKGLTVRAEEKTVIVVEDDEEEDEGEDEEELSDNEYIVEAIKSHIIDEEGVIRFQVKWKGWDKKSDLTWEPEDNLTGTASDVLNEYYESVGGREFVLNPGVEEDTNAKSKKRGRSSTGVSTNGKKRKAEKIHPKDGTPPASVAASFKPPSGSWEQDIASIDACEDNHGNVMVFLQWQTGQRTQHPLHVVYQRCPQRMLKFYESHLLFTPLTKALGISTNFAQAFLKRAVGRQRRIV